MKFYLPILLLLLVSVTSIHKRRKGFFKFHPDNSVFMQLPNETEERELVFTFNQVTEQGILLDKLELGRLPEEYDPYFQTKKLYRGMLIPFPYIKTILKERKGRILENLHLMISPDDSRQQALISIYLPKDIRKETIEKVEKGVKESRVVGYSIQLHSRLQMLNNQFKNNCKPVKKLGSLKKHIFSLIRRSQNLRKELGEYLEKKNNNKKANLQETYYYSNYGSFDSAFPIEDIKGDCYWIHNKLVAEDKRGNVVLTVYEKDYIPEKIGREGLDEAIKMLNSYFFPNYQGKFVGLTPEEIYEAINHIFPKDNASECSVHTQFDKNGKKIN